MNDAVRLKRIRDQLAAIAPGDWLLSVDVDGMFVEARGSQGELLPILRFRPEATQDEIEFVTAAPGTIRFLLGLVDRAIVALRSERAQSRPRPSGGAAKDYAAEAAMKCQEPGFKAFLEARHGLERPLTDDRAAQKLRSLLGITSRKTLNEDAAAAERWKRLRADYDAWRRAG